MKKALRVVLFLAATAGLAMLWPRVYPSGNAPESVLTVTRVWNAETESAVGAWLRSRAAAYEKETGHRVYLRASRASDADAALENGLPPDVLIGTGGSVCAALRGYGLFVRDDRETPLTPAPTGVLFFRPSPSPGPAPTPAPWPEENLLSAVLAPPELANALPGAISDPRAAESFAQGKANAALLTAGQAAALPFGCRAYALPEGKGFLPVGASSFSPEGEAFLDYLTSEASRRALASFGLYAPGLRLYGADDPLRALIEGGLVLAE